MRQLLLILFGQYSKVPSLIPGNGHAFQQSSLTGTASVPVVPVVPVSKDMKVSCITAFLYRSFFDTRANSGRTIRRNQTPVWLAAHRTRVFPGYTLHLLIT
jgi:hypothetical protein